MSEITISKISIEKQYCIFAILLTSNRTLCLSRVSIALVHNTENPSYLFIVNKILDPYYSFCVSHSSFIPF